jgi:hypothetical protein
MSVSVLSTRVRQFCLLILIMFSLALTLTQAHTQRENMREASDAIDGLVDDVKDSAVAFAALFNPTQFARAPGKSLRKMRLELPRRRALFASSASSLFHACAQWLWYL